MADLPTDHTETCLGRRKNIPLNHRKEVTKMNGSRTDLAVEAARRLSLSRDIEGAERRIDIIESAQLEMADITISTTAAANAIDGKLETIWHSQYKPAEKPYPHFIQVDLGKATTAAGFIYTPRQDYNYNGIIRDYELYFSNDGKTWGAPVAKGAFDGSTTPQTVKFVRPAKGRYVLFKALATFGGGNLASMAELDLVAE